MVIVAAAVCIFKPITLIRYAFFIFRVLLKLNVHVISCKPICCWIKALVWILRNLARDIMKLLYLQMTGMSFEAICMLLHRECSVLLASSFIRLVVASKDFEKMCTHLEMYNLLQNTRISIY